MTVDELWTKVDAKMTSLDTKLDDVKTTVRLHDQSLVQYKSELNAVEKKFDKQIEEIKAEKKDEHANMKSRLSKLEKWMWFMLGAGGSSGAVLAKMFGG